jgi:hypothetical protein
MFSALIENSLIPVKFSLQHFCSRTFRVKKGRYRSKVEARILAGLGLVPGIPDVVCVRAGQMYTLELKARKGELTHARKDCLTALTAADAVVGVAFGIDEALRWLEMHALLRGCSQ